MVSDGDFSVTHAPDPSLTTTAEPDPDAVHRVRIRLDVSYDGTDFSGWAVQPDRRTVQDVVQQALCTVLRVPSAELTVAGRTDAGVHATGQVAHVDVPVSAWDGAHGRLVHKLAGVLPPDVRVFGATQVPHEFDARFGALWRRYVYRICDAKGGVEPLLRRQVLAWSRELDTEAMAAAAVSLVGRHDFVAFCRRRPHATTVRCLQAVDVARDGDHITCTVHADAFCRSMVRSVVGSLLAVGEGRRPVDWPASLLNHHKRCDDIGVAPAHGLTLVAVAYPPDDGLRARAELTRARRA
jgi:tRNA pseudouridine38-40 synthase